MNASLDSDCLPLGVAVLRDFLIAKGDLFDTQAELSRGRGLFSNLEMQARSVFAI